MTPDAGGMDRPIDDILLRVLSRGDARAFEIGAPDNDPLARVFEATTQSLLRHVGATIRNAELAPLLAPDRVRVRTVPPAGIGALTLWIAPRHVVAVNRGLAMFVYRLARAFAPHVTARGPDDPPTPPDSEAVGIIATLLDWMGSPVRAPLVEDWPVAQGAIDAAERLTRAAERFVMGHEIGHISGRHLIADADKLAFGPVGPLDLDTRPVEQEIQADLAGTFFAVESMQREGLDPRDAVAGIYFFFRALQLGEKVGAVHVDAAHLPAEERLELCDRMIGERYQSLAPTFRQLARAVDTAFAPFARQAVQERESRHRVAAARMDEVLGTTPWWRDRRDFARDTRLVEEMRLLTSRSPGAVLAALAANLLDADSYRQLHASAGSMAALEQDDRWRRHSVAHFIARNASMPVRRALGVETLMMGGQA